MYFTPTTIGFALGRLRQLHPFLGITYLVFKQHEIPVGRTAPLAINALEEAFLEEHFKPDRRSTRYYQPFKSDNRWLSPRYPSTGLQSIRTRGAFANSLLHQRGTDLWGWKNDYIATLERQLDSNDKIPAFALAVWLYRDHDWAADTDARNVVTTFLRDFNILKEERSRLFDLTIPKVLEGVFTDRAASSSEIKQLIGSPPDAAPEEEGVLTYLEIAGVGPAVKMVLEPAPRLTLIAGDNGLGKTLLLDVAWWALTGEWAALQAYPARQNAGERAQIAFSIASGDGEPSRVSIQYDPATHQWPGPRKRPTLPGLTVYARVDGSFAVWDPKRLHSARRAIDDRRTMVFTREELWSGQSGTIEGLLRDWVKWQATPSKHPFREFSAVLSRLSPADLAPLTPSEPVRLPGYPQEIPTLHHPYGDVPILLASAGVRRIVTLAYLIVWAWNEHKIAAAHQQQPAQRQMVVLIDEMEAHLHPQWQRVVLPSLLEVGRELSSDLRSQFLVATHAPLVLASMESGFSDETDKLYHLGIAENNSVQLDEIPYYPRGPVDAWLTSEAFELRQPRSTDSERAIEFAKGLQTKRTTTSKEVAQATALLKQYLPPDDEFWPRWVLFADKHGIQL